MVQKIHQKQKTSLSTVLAWSTVVVPECCFIVIFIGIFYFYDIFDVLHFFTFYICFYLSMFVQYFGLYTGSRVESPFSKPLSKLHV